MKGDSVKNNLTQGDLFGLDLTLTKPEVNLQPKPVKSAECPKKAVKEVDPVLLKAENFRKRISERFGEQIVLRVNNNRTSLISFKRRDGFLILRLNIAILDVPEKTVGDLVHWMKLPRLGAPESIKSFIKTLPHKETTRPKKRLYTKTAAQVHDLEVLFHQVNKEFFDGEIMVDITFGRDSSKQRVRVRRLGSFSHSQRLITIHPILDDKRVPEFVVSFIIYHEMLHALQRPDQKRFHDTAFRRREKAHRDYDKVVEWQKKHSKYLAGKIR